MALTITQRPAWLKKRLITSRSSFDTRAILAEGKIHTVCESAICPNQNECFSRREATFLLLGDICTRTCSFCSVKKGVPLAVDKDEPLKILDAVKKLKLKYAVITSVTRDDLEDGGASQFAKVIGLIRDYSQEIKVEVLTPDFGGDCAGVKMIAEAGPDIFSHNIETVRRLYPVIRAGADYHRSLELLRYVKEIKALLLTKSSIMVGLGESEEDLAATMRDLRLTGCDILAIGQYLQSRQENVPIVKYVTPPEFDRYKAMALEYGFKYVASGPFVRSSYRAEETYLKVSNHHLTRS